MVNNWDYILTAKDILDSTPLIKEWDDLSEEGYKDAVNTGNTDRYWRSAFGILFKEAEEGG